MRSHRNLTASTFTTLPAAAAGDSLSPPDTVTPLPCLFGVFADCCGFCSRCFR
ncbi:hypothetical protein PF005_g12726 [Phytophthora fragariae]|uniref:Uncharacterized protein n=1 Tax=Phytophthora fragariae TaxID=53985 RepID=A0A6A3XRL5_9STRA|nr:hypothetical protein PF003_g6390 [Phytophthora fragariae]KAE8936637.1 hypothetical protein PF009_g13453 [Phytophthora fragariae]KAE9003987.1 hypothetical protein PF011_g12658 [Phytophthora fragariae]KAE9107246.1 hypothetical protein PF010_g12338 [Phytophthora fragariae]KAE9207183.1 hypothetical protein PF005_g12726 [Phytophthora fragariae]